MRAAIVALVTTVAFVTSVTAQPTTKILVLPLDGNAPDAQRTAINESVVKLARDRLIGDVTVGETTFRETAAAVGCDPATASCAEQVRTTLAVDELVYGSATSSGGTTTITVLRASAGTAPRTQISVISETDPAEAAEANLEPLFTPNEPVGSDALGSDVAEGSGSAVVAPPVERTSFFDSTDRKVGAAFVGGGVISLVIGFAMWSSASSLQDDIDSAPRSTLDEINELKELEDRAQGKANWGNVFFGLGLVATGVGGYFLWRDRKHRQTTTITPAPTDAGTGMTFVLRGRW